MFIIQDHLSKYVTQWKILSFLVWYSNILWSHDHHPRNKHGLTDFNQNTLTLAAAIPNTNDGEPAVMLLFHVWALHCLPAVEVVNLGHVSKENVPLAAQDQRQESRQSRVVHLRPVTLTHNDNMQIIHRGVSTPPNPPLNNHKVFFHCRSFLTSRIDSSSST